jgi:hypothetical protein
MTKILIVEDSLCEGEQTRSYCIGLNVAGP